jgi:hypothetical protein
MGRLGNGVGAAILNKTGKKKVSKVKNKCTFISNEFYLQCQLYKEGKINGSLCQSLCVSGRVKFSACTDFHGGKRVNIMNCSGYCVKGKTVSAVLKSPDSDNWEHLRIIPDIRPDDLQSENVTTVEKYIDVEIRKRLEWEFGFVPFSSDTDATRVMWERDSEEFMRTHHDKLVAFKTVLLLLDQSEYKAVKALENSGVVPQIYGTCGPLYLQVGDPQEKDTVKLRYHCFLLMVFSLFFYLQHLTFLNLMFVS